MLGHTNIKTTQIYARVTQQKIGEEMINFSHELDKKGNNKRKKSKSDLIKDKIIEIADRMKKSGLDNAQISYYTDLSIDEILDL